MAKFKNQEGQVVRAPHNSPAADQPVAELVSPSMPEQLRSYLQRVQLQYAALPDNIEEAWGLVARGLQMEATGRIIAGYHLKQLRESLPSQGFSAGLAERAIPRRSAYDAIDAYELFSALPSEESIRALAQIGITKVRALGFQSPEEYAEFAEGKQVRGLTYDQAVEMSSRELTDHQRQWQAEHDDEVAKWKAKAHQAEVERDTARNEAAARLKEHAAILAAEDMPAFAFATRQEAMVLGEKIAFAIESLEEVANKNLFSSTDDEGIEH